MKILVEEAIAIIVLNISSNCSKGTIKRTLRRKAEANDAKTKCPKIAMTIKIVKIARDGTGTNHLAHSAYNHLVLDHRSCFRQQL